MRGGGEGGGGGTRFVFGMNFFIVDHASLSRPSTNPTPNKRHLQPLGARFIYILINTTLTLVQATVLRGVADLYP